MIELDELNEFDNDFITLWSDYFLNQDASKVIKPLEKLAEMGQINAVQTWLLLKKFEDRNEIIEKYIEKLLLKNSYDFEECLVLANYFYQFDTTEQQDEFAKIRDSLYQYVMQYDQTNDQSLVQTIEYLKHNFRGFCSVEYNYQAGVALNQIISETSDPIFAESLFETLLSTNFYYFIVKPSFIKKTKNALIKENKKYPEDVQVQFFLAKHLAMFGDRKESEMGKQMLSKLSERELSDKLKQKLENEDLQLNSNEKHI